jgi:hypothetical protein
LEGRVWPAWQLIFYLAQVRWTLPTHSAIEACNAAASVKMECGFNKGGIMVTKKQFNLKEETIRSAQLIGSWGNKGLIPESKLFKYFSDINKWSKKPECGNN